MTTAEAIVLLRDVFLLGMLILLPVALTSVLFHSRNVMLGFPATIFWAILGGYCYTESVATWDIYYFMFFASMGMAIFAMYAMYGLRARDLAGPDADEGRFIDEEKEPDIRGDVEKRSVDQSDRRQALHARADKRRTGGVRKKNDWGDFE